MVRDRRRDRIGPGASRDSSRRGSKVGDLIVMGAQGRELWNSLCLDRQLSRSCVAACPVVRALQARGEADVLRHRGRLDCLAISRQRLGGLV